MFINIITISSRHLEETTQFGCWIFFNEFKIISLLIKVKLDYTL